MNRRRLMAGVGLVACAAVGVAIAGTGTANASSAAPTSVNISTPSAPNGWANGGSPEISPTYVSGPAGADGNGSLKFAIAAGDTTTHVDYYHAAGNVPLATVHNLAYSIENTGGAQASYQLEICAGGITGTTCNGFTTEVFEPYQQPGAPGTTAGDGTWHVFSNLEAATFWSTHSIPGQVGSSGSNQLKATLPSIIAANPNAIVFAYGISQGSNNPGSTSYVDDVEFNGVETNFENDLLPTALVTTPASIYITGLLGIKISIPPSPSATLTSGGVPLVGRSVLFTAGNTVLCVGITNALGVATCQAPLLSALTVLLSGGYTATYAGDAVYAASTAHGTLLG